MTGDDDLDPDLDPEVAELAERIRARLDGHEQEVAEAYELGRAAGLAQAWPGPRRVRACRADCYWRRR